MTWSSGVGADEVVHASLDATYAGAPKPSMPIGIQCARGVDDERNTGRGRSQSGIAG